MAGDPRRPSVRVPGRPPPAVPRPPARTIPDSGQLLSTVPGGARHLSEEAPEALPPEQRADENLTPEAPGRYQVRREFGRGGMSVVYLAHDSHIGRDVALKQLLPEAMEQMADVSGGDTSAPWARFVREARITGMLEHPSIVPVYEIGRRDDGTLYYTQKLIRGRTLTEELKHCATPQERLRVLPHFVNLCQAIAYAHRRGVIHRDIKPDNVMVGEFGETVVLDWGLAKPKGHADHALLRKMQEEEVQETQEGMVLGTPAYMSPEQACGAISDVDEKSDVWSLGAVLYQVLTGRPPFVGKTAMDVILKVNSEPVVPVRELNKEAPRELSAVCEKALKKKKHERYADARALAAEVLAWQTGARVSAYAYSSVELLRRLVARNKKLTAVVALAAVLVTAAAVVATLKYREATRELARTFRERSARAEGDLRWDRAMVLAAAARRELDLPEVDFRIAQGPPREVWPSFALPQNGLVYAVAFSHDGRMLAAARRDRTIDVLQVPGGKRLARLEGNESTVISMSWNGTTLASAGQDGTVRLYSGDSGEQVARLEVGPPQHAVAFSPDGERLAAGGSDGTLRLWEVPAQARGVEIGTHDGEINAVSFSPDGRHLATASGDGTVGLWDAHTGGALGKLRGHTAEVTGAAFTTDGSRLVSASRDGTVGFWDTASGQLLARADPELGPLVALALSGDGRTFAIRSLRGPVALGDVQTRSLVVRLPDRHPFAAVGFSPDGKLLTASGLDGSLRVWNVATGSQSYELPTVAPFFTGASVAFSPDRRTLAAGSTSGPIGLWDVQTRQLVSVLPGHSSSVTALAFSPDGKLFASGAYDGGVLVWSAEEGRIRARLDGHESTIAGLGFARDGRALASASTDRTVRVWDLAHGGAPNVIDAGFPVAALAVSVDGKVLATAGEDQPIRMWDRGTGKLLRELGEKSQSALALAFSPDGALLVSGYKNGTAGLWTAEGRKRGLLRGHQDRVWSAVFSPDGATIATASLDGTVRLWDTATRLPVATLPRALAHAVAFSRDGKLLASAGADPAVQLLELADRRKLRPARSDLDFLQKKYGLRLVGVDLVELEPR